jgi:hypothetical protein
MCILFDGWWDLREGGRFWISGGGVVGLSKALWSLGYCVYEQGVDGDTCMALRCF